MKSGVAQTKTYKGFRFDLTRSSEIDQLWNELNPLDLERYPRMWYKDRLINYPMSPFNVIRNLGIGKSGPALYKAFFKDYNQKLWSGERCRGLFPDWVGQRVKNLTLSQAVFDAIGLSIIYFQPLVY